MRRDETRRRRAGLERDTGLPSSGGRGRHGGGTWDTAASESATHRRTVSCQLAAPHLVRRRRESCARMSQAVRGAPWRSTRTYRLPLSASHVAVVSATRGGVASCAGVLACLPPRWLARLSLSPLAVFDSAGMLLTTTHPLTPGLHMRAHHRISPLPPPPFPRLARVTQPARSAARLERVPADAADARRPPARMNSRPVAARSILFCREGRTRKAGPTQIDGSYNKNIFQYHRYTKMLD